MSKLIALLTLALCWAHRVGEWLVEQRAISIKQHGRKAQCEQCTGLDHLRQILLNLDSWNTQSLQVLHLLSRT